MPREFIPKARKRERARKPMPSQKLAPRSKDKMLRSSVNRTLRQCAQYEADHWPEPNLQSLHD